MIRLRVASAADANQVKVSHGMAAKRIFGGFILNPSKLHQASEMLWIEVLYLDLGCSPVKIHFFTIWIAARCLENRHEMDTVVPPD